MKIYEKGTTPLHIACDKGHKEIVQSLLESGSKHDNEDEHGWISLHYAVLCGNKEIVNLLISQGSDVNSRTISFFFFYHFISINFPFYFNNFSILFQ